MSTSNASKGSVAQSGSVSKGTTPATGPAFESTDEHPVVHRTSAVSDDRFPPAVK